MESTLTNRASTFLGTSAPELAQLRAYSTPDLWRLWGRVALALARALCLTVGACGARVLARDELRELDSRTLRDIGVRKEQVGQEIRKPLWVD